THDVKYLAFSPDGVALLTAGGATPGLRIWDVAAGRLRLAPPNTSSITMLAFAPDGKTLALGQADGIVKLWDATTWKERVTLPAHSAAVSFIGFSPDSKLLATAS